MCFCLVLLFKWKLQVVYAKKPWQQIVNRKNMVQ